MSFIIFINGVKWISKSTLLNILSGNLKPQKGEIFFSKRGSKVYQGFLIYIEFSLINSTIAENVASVSKEKVDYPL